MFTNFGIPDIERRKRKRNLLIGQPTTKHPDISLNTLDDALKIKDLLDSDRIHKLKKHWF